MAKKPWEDYHCPACYKRVMRGQARREELSRNEVHHTGSKSASPRTPELSVPKMLSDKTKGCVFAKSCKLPSGVINHSENGFIPVGSLQDYGAYAVLATRSAIAAGNTPLEWVGGSDRASAVAKRLGGRLSLGLVSTVSSVGLPLIVGTVTLLMPNTTSADSAFYTSEQYAQLRHGNTRVRANVKYLPDGAISAYGFYTGNKPEWQQVPVIAAQARGEQLVADIGNGIEVIWTPAVDTDEVLGIPALEGASLQPAAWVFPETEQAARILVNPEHPPEFQDAIIWFPSQPQIAPIYLSLNRRHVPGAVTGVGEKVPGVWLAGAGLGVGVPIPTRIADKLRGLEFSDFDRFRNAFWQEVAMDPELAKQFNPSNLERIKNGHAPKAMKVDHTGKRRSFELHHIEWISKGGALYDIDNMRINTPSNHIDIHRKK